MNYLGTYLYLSLIEILFAFESSRCQFHQHFTRTFFVQKFLQSQNVTRKKAFICKIRAFNVDEIDHSDQFITVDDTKN